MVWVRVRSGWLAKNTGQVTGQPVFTSSRKNQVRIRYFSGWVELGQKILTCFSMSNQKPKTHWLNRKSQNWLASELTSVAIFGGTTRVSLLRKSVAWLASEISGGLLRRSVRWEWGTRDKEREWWEWKHQREKERVRWRGEKKSKI